MKSFSFHGNQFWIEREMGLESSTPYVERVVTTEPLFPHLLNLTNGRGLPLSITNQVTVHSLPPAASLTDFTMLAQKATTGLARPRDAS
jgi:hypothetical protein